MQPHPFEVLILVDVTSLSAWDYLGGAYQEKPPEMIDDTDVVTCRVS